MIVRVHPEEFIGIAAVAITQLVRKQALGNDHGAQGLRSLSTRIGDGVLGAVGELVFARHRGMCPEFSASGMSKGHPDVGDYHVRTVKYATGYLPVQEGDAHGVYVLVVLRTFPFEWEVRGWFSHDGTMADENWFDPKGDPPYWRVPQSALAPIESLP